MEDDDYSVGGIDPTDFAVASGSATPGIPAEAIAAGGPNMGYFTKRADAREQRLSHAYQTAIDAINAQKGPSNAERWFNLAAAFAQPTENGKWYETLGNVAMAMSSDLARRREFGVDKDKAIRDLLTAREMAGIKSEETMDGLILKYLTAARKPTRLAFDALGRARDPYTGSVVSGPGGRPVAPPPATLPADAFGD